MLSRRRRLTRDEKLENEEHWTLSGRRKTWFASPEPSGVHRSCSLLLPEARMQNRRTPSTAKEEKKILLCFSYFS
jgi:hypothetical protein